jgi:CRISPR/Cas system-associated exonuclease Cas4 (RecB family)
VDARTEAAAEPTDALGCARRYLFAPGEPRPARQDPSLELFSAAGEGLEFVEIARRIGALAANGTPFDRVAILLRSPERNQPLVEEALVRAGIPAYFSRGAIRPDPAGRAFLALLACAGEGLPASRFAEYLSLAQVPPLDDNGAPVRQELAWAASGDEFLDAFQPDFDAPPEPEPEPTFEAPIGWEKLLVDAAVVGGTSRWARRLEGLEREIELQIPEADPERQPGLERRLRQLRRLQRFALPLIDLLAGLPKQARWGEWIERLTELAQTSLRSPESVMGVLNELKPMGDVGPADLDEVYGVLSDRLRFLRREPPARRYGRVFVGSFDEVRGRVFDAVFVPGLAEGMFPRRAYEDPLLLDNYRDALETSLPRQEVRFARERLLLRSALASASRKMVVSYPRMDVAQARPRVPSFYLLEVIRAAEGALPSIRDLERRAAEGALTRLGWPAPADPKLAIDTAEYDLAVLEAARQRPDNARGAGRYMVDASPPLARSMRARWRRWNRNWWPVDGMVAEPESPALRLLHGHKLGARSYSPTALQHYAACPYRFFLYSVAQLRPREDAVPLEQMDPLTRGGLFHSVVFKLLVGLEERDLLPLTEGRQADALELADRTLDAEADRYREELAPAIPRVWETEVEDLRTDLRGWVRHAIVPGGEWRPHRFELAFGIVNDEADRDATSSPDPVEVLPGMLLRGSVDLVERSAKRGVLRVVDHKTGRAPQAEIGYVAGGTILQPLLYAMAVERLLGTPVESGVLSFCTQRGGYQDIRIDATPLARQRVDQALRLVGAGIEGGFLPAAPNPGACQYCDYTRVCGPYEEQRVRKKAAGRLEQLTELRKMP